jgi:hypothetical protein
LECGGKAGSDDTAFGWTGRVGFSTRAVRIESAVALLFPPQSKDTFQRNLVKRGCDPSRAGSAGVVGVKSFHASHNFESVCRTDPHLEPAVTDGQFNSKDFATTIATSVKESLARHERLWLYRVKLGIRSEGNRLDRLQP